MIRQRNEAGSRLARSTPSANALRWAKATTKHDFSVETGNVSASVDSSWCRTALVIALLFGFVPACSGTDAHSAADAKLPEATVSDSGASTTGDVSGGVDGSAGEGGLYLVGATIITASGGPPLLEHAVIVRGNRVVAIAPAQTDPPADLQSIDLTGLTLLPGLIDSHVHLGSTEARQQLAVARHIEFGVTATKEVGAELYPSIRLRDDLKQKRLPGPRLKIAGALFTHPNGHPITTLFKNQSQEFIDASTRRPVTPEAARREVRALAAAGVDHIKAVLTACTSLDGCGRLDPTVLAAIVDEAHASGLRVVVHTDEPEDVRDALAAGADGVEHGVTEGELDQSLAEQLAADGVFYVPTVTVAEVYSSSTREEIVARLALLRTAGVKVVPGTDAENFGVTWGASLHRELIRMTEAGYGTMEALISATRLAAEHFGMGDELGRIAVGMLADLIAVKGDPLVDLAALADVRLVVVDGEVLRCEQLTCP
jgi:imidazolonepropionase-like amidohydrolase